VGNDRLDKQFDKKLAKKNKPIRGAYHYYRPNENSPEQAALLLNGFFEKDFRF
jgi:lysozyme